MSIDQDIANSAKQLDIDVRVNHQITNGDENTEVETEGGPVPSIRKRLKDIESEWAKTADPLADNLAQAIQLTKEYQENAAASSFTAAEQSNLSKQAADASAKHAKTSTESANEAIINAKLAAEEMQKVIAEGSSQVKEILDEGQRQVGLVTDTGAQQTANVKAYADQAEDAKNLAEQAETNSELSAFKAAQDALAVNAIAEKFSDDSDQAIVAATEQANIATLAAEKSASSEARSFQNANRSSIAADQAEAASKSSAVSANVSEISASNASANRTEAEKAQIRSELASADSEEAKIVSETAASQSVTYAEYSRQSADNSSTQADRAETEADRAKLEADRASIAGGASQDALKKTSNLADLTDKAISRTNLDVYSTVETDDKINCQTLFPDQSGQSGKLLSTNGTKTEWVEPPITLPYQTGHDGKFLQTNGNVATWQFIPVVNPNLLINGDLSVCQRGTVFDFSGYTADMWYVDNLITGHLDVSVDPIIHSELAFGSQCSSWVNGIRQILRSKMYWFSGKQVTAHAIVSGPQGKTTKISIDDIGESPPFTFTGQSQHISHTFTVTDDISVLPKDVIIRFHKDCTASPNEIVYLSDMKLEIGNVATIFTQYEYISNLLNCQRYYYQLDYGDYLGVGSGQSGNLRYIYRHPIEMELLPVVTVEGNVLTKLGGSGSNTSSTPMNVDFVNKKSMSITTVNGYRADFTAPYGMVEGTVKVSAEP